MSELGERSTNEPQSIKNFNPDKTGHDRFGNIQLKENNTNVLASSAGQDFLSQHPHIYSQIESAVKNDSPTTLENGAKLSHLDRGAQSNVYILEIDDKKYIIKSRMDTRIAREFSSPHYDQMLQTQDLQQNLSRKMRETRVELPEYLFASENLSCQEFVEGTALNQRDEMLNSFAKSANDYIKKRHSKKDPLWTGTSLDIASYKGLLGHIILDVRPSEAIQRNNGIVVWIDPFIYNPSVKTQSV